MNADRRSHHASSLRRFFDEQLLHLQELFVRLSHHRHDAAKAVREDRLIVESFVNSSNTKMRAIHGYEGRLRKHVCALYHHVLQVADTIPPPIVLDQKAFRTDPLLNALFVYGKEIEDLFVSDPEIKGYLRVHNKIQVPEIYALLTANKTEKRVFGVGMQGDMLIRDVPQQTVNFAAYKIHTPCASDAELSTAVKNYLFDRVVTLVKQDLASRKADQAFLHCEASYEARVKSLANPDIYLDTLVDYLEVPAKLLNIEKIHFKLSKLGVKLNNDDRQSANEFDLYELTWGDQSRNVVLRVVHTR